jgi:hypothetical protein
VSFAATATRIDMARNASCTLSVPVALHFLPAKRANISDTRRHAANVTRKRHHVWPALTLCAHTERVKTSHARRRILVS